MTGVVKTFGGWPCLLPRLPRLSLYLEHADKGDHTIHYNCVMRLDAQRTNTSLHANGLQGLHAFWD